MKATQFSLVNQVLTSPENTVVLVGAALNGPSNIPFTLKDDQEPHNVLGQSPLADAYVAARRLGHGQVIAYRINGTHSIATLSDKNGKGIMEFRSISAADIYNEISLVVYPTHLFLKNTDGTTRTYFFEKHKTAYELAYAINRDAFYGLVEFNAAFLDEYYQLANIVDGETHIMFKGGSSESHLINDRNPLSDSYTIEGSITSLLKERLSKALFGEDPDDVLERQPNSNLGALHCGVVVLCDMFHDDIERDEENNEKDAGFTEMLASFCMNKTYETGCGCIGAIGTKPIYSPDTIEDRVTKLVSLSESIADEEYYKYVQVIVGHTEYPELVNNSVSIAYAYAISQAQFPYYTMMSNKGIRGFGKLNFEISKEDVALLTANGYTCIVPSIRRGFVPFFATSYSKDKESVMSKPHNLRTSQYVSRRLVEEVDLLIGSNYNVLSIKESLEKAKGVLDNLVATKVIRSYGLNHELLKGNTVLNIYASLTPFSEIKSVGTVATISFPQGVIA